MWGNIIFCCQSHPVCVIHLKKKKKINHFWRRYQNHYFVSHEFFWLTVIKSKPRKANELNPARKPSMKLWWWLAVLTNNFPAIPAAKLIANDVLCIPLDLVGEGEVHVAWTAQGFRSLCPGDANSCLTTKGLNFYQTGWHYKIHACLI